MAWHGGYGQIQCSKVMIVCEEIANKCFEGRRQTRLVLMY
jgi:hypothetical protein